MKEQLKWTAGWINTLLILGALATVGYFWGGIELRMYDSPEQKWEEERHVEKFEEYLEIMREEQRIEKRERDSVTEIFTSGLNYLNTIETRAEDRKMRQAVTEFQAKQNTDTLVKYWRDYNESVEE